MGAIGIPEDRMVLAIINPETKRPISPVTLRKHFREELDQGIVQADLKAAANLLKLTESSAAAAIFWAKCRLRWRERDTPAPLAPPAPLGPDGKPLQQSEAEKRSVYDLGRRIAFALYMAGEIEEPPQPA